MFRTRFKKEIVAEFLLRSPGKQQKVIILCDGMPSIRESSLSSSIFPARLLGLVSRCEEHGKAVDDPRNISAPDISTSSANCQRNQRACLWPEISLLARQTFVIGGSFGAQPHSSSLDSRSRSSLPIAPWWIGLSCGRSKKRKLRTKAILHTSVKHSATDTPVVGIGTN